MDRDLMNLLRCPLHPTQGTLRRMKKRIFRRGKPHWRRALVCRSCGEVYPIVHGIIDMLPAQQRSDFLDKEMHQWDEQAEHYDERVGDEVYVRGIEAAAAALDARDGEVILDAGCGTGLTTRTFHRVGLKTISLDLSLHSLRVLRHRHQVPGLLCVRGDLSALPFAPAAFDRVLCANVITQLPGLELRKKAIGELARVARPGVRVAVTAQNYSRPKKSAGWQKEGPARGPSGEVHYVYRFDKDEFVDLLSSGFAVERVSGAGLPLPYRFKLTHVMRRLDRFLWRFGSTAEWGNMLVAECRTAGNKR